MILLRKEKLILATSDAAESSEGEDILVEIEPGMFKIGEEETAERIKWEDGEYRSANRFLEDK